MNDEHLSREQLYEYDDGVLPAVERRAVERHLENCAECQARLARSAALPRALKEQLGGTHAPVSLRLALRRELTARDPGPGRLPPARRPALALVPVAALVLLALVLAIAIGANGAPPLLTQLVETHRQVVLDPQAVQRQGSAAELGTWLSDQLHTSIEVPTPEGFSLVGARVEQVDRVPAAHVVYRQSDGSAMSLFMWRGLFPTDDFALRQVDGGRFYVGTPGGQSVVLWSEHDLNYACVGDAAPDAMLALAAGVWRSDQN